MNRVPVRPSLIRLMALEERDIIRRGGIVVQVLDTDVQRADVNVEFFYPGQQVIQVVRSQDEMR